MQMSIHFRSTKLKSGKCVSGAASQNRKGIFFSYYARTVFDQRTSYKIGFLTIFEFTNQILLSTLEIKVQDLQIMMLEKGKGNETL